MADERTQSEFFNELMGSVIDTIEELKWMKERNFTILCLESEYEKKRGEKSVYAECEKVPAKWKWAVPTDFTITFFTPNLIGFNDQQLAILMEHELRHIGQKDDGTLYVVPHDIEDFTAIIGTYGVRWADTKGQGGV